MTIKLKLSVILAVQLAFAASVQAEVRWLDNIVAVAGQQTITQSELDNENKLVARELRSRGSTNTDQTALSRQVLERLVLKKLQLQAAKRVGVTVDEATLDTAVNNIAEENQMTLSRFRVALGNEGIDYKDFRRNIRDELIITQLRERQVRQINITDQEIDDLLAANQGDTANREYRLAHILIAVPEAATPQQVEAARAEAQQVQARAGLGSDFTKLAIEHSDGQRAMEGGDLGWRTGNQLPAIFSEEVRNMSANQISNPIRSPSGYHLVKLVDVRGGGNSKPMVQQTRARHILLKDSDGQAKLTQMRSTVLSGGDFAELAKQHSADKGSGAKGGELGWAVPGTYVTEFEEALRNLKDNEISQPFRTQFGWHIVQLLERRQAAVPDNMMRMRAREVLAKQKREEELQLWLRRLRDEAYVEYRLPGMESSS